MATSLDQSGFMKTALRLPRDMHAWLMEFAAEQGLSLNAAILEIVEERRRGKLPVVETGKLSDEALDAIESRMRHALKHK